MVAGCQSRFSFLAADPLSAERSCSPLKDKKSRLGFFCEASGRHSRRRRFRSMFAPGSRACGYKTASGRANWPNRDPINELGFELLQYGDIRDEMGRSTPYTFVANNPISAIDFLGLKLGDVPGEIPFPPYNPPDAGKPCCCSPPAVVTGTRNDWSPILGWSILGIYDRWLLTLGVELHVAGNPDCFEDVEVQWARCWGVGGAGYMGSGTSVQVYVDTQLGIGVSWTTVAKINFLTCKGGLWTKDFRKASKPYNWTGSGWNFQ